MIFHENHLLADDSHEIYLILFRKLRKMSQKVSSAAVVIGAFRVKIQSDGVDYSLFVVAPNASHCTVCFLAFGFSFVVLSSAEEERDICFKFMGESFQDCS